MKPLISIIIPVYNTEKYLPRCLESAINQTYKNIEIIIVNDCSMGNCEEIVKKYQEQDKRIQYIANKVNLGTFVTRNNGIMQAQGSYVLFLDSDDWINKQLCEKLSVELDKNYDFIAFGLSYIHDNNSFEEMPDVNIESYTHQELMTKFEMLELEPWFLVRRAFKRELLIKVCLKLQINDHLSMNEDVLFFMVYLFYVQKASMIQYNGYNYDCTDNMSATRNTTKSIETFSKNLVEYQKIIFYLERVYKEEQRDIAHLFAIRQEFFRFFITQLQLYSDQPQYMEVLLPKAMETFKGDVFAKALFDIRYNISLPSFLRKINYIIVNFMNKYIKEESTLYNVLKTIWIHIKKLCHIR